MYDGRVYDSKAEAIRASELALLKKSGHIDEWHEQVPFTLGDVPYRADFVVTSKATTWVEEVKGYETQRFRLIRRLWPKYGPCTMRIMKRKGNRWCIEHLEVSEMNERPDDPRRIIKAILAVVCDYYGVTFDDLKGRYKPARIADARRMAMAMIYNKTTWTNQEVGRLFEKHHSTVVLARQLYGPLKSDDYNMLCEKTDLRLHGKQPGAYNPGSVAERGAGPNNSVEETQT
jgi:hypothetical protein